MTPAKDVDERRRSDGEWREAPVGDGRCGASSRIGAILSSRRRLVRPPYAATDLDRRLKVTLGLPDEAVDGAF